MMNRCVGMAYKSSLVVLGMGVLGIAPATDAALVWESTFSDGTADGVVDVVDRNLTKDMLGPVTNGRLQVTAQDRAGAHNNNDRAGRPLGATLNGNSTFSGLYRFNYSALNESASPQAWTQVGFIGTNDNVTRQVIGVMMRHNKAGGNYFTSLDLVFGESGTGNFYFDATGTGGFGPIAPTGIFLGNESTAFNRDLQLAISYDGVNHILTAELFDAQGTLISGNAADLDDKLIPIGGNTVATMYNALAVTHLGWADYTAGSGNQTIVKQVNNLLYFNTEDGARLAALPEPASLGFALAAASLLAFARRREPRD